MMSFDGRPQPYLPPPVNNFPPPIIDNSIQLSSDVQQRARAKKRPSKLKHKYIYININYRKNTTK